jgi:hypothetical protein
MRNARQQAAGRRRAASSTSVRVGHVAIVFFVGYVGHVVAGPKSVGRVLSLLAMLSRVLRP